MEAQFIETLGDRVAFVESTVAVTAAGENYDQTEGGTGSADQKGIHVRSEIISFIAAGSGGRIFVKLNSHRKFPLYKISISTSSKITAAFQEYRRFAAPADYIRETESETAAVGAFGEDVKFAGAVVLPYPAGELH
jgi:hypothetical protein